MSTASSVHTGEPHVRMDLTVEQKMRGFTFYGASKLMAPNIDHNLCSAIEVLLSRYFSISPIVSTLTF